MNDLSETGQRGVSCDVLCRFCKGMVHHCLLVRLWRFVTAAVRGCNGNTKQGYDII